jgi:HNH endonuclease
MAIGTLTLRNKVWQAYSKRCHICQEPVPLEEMDLDHLTPKSRGGTDDWRNLAPTHAQCNRSKGNLGSHTPIAGQLAMEGIGVAERTPATKADIEDAARIWIQERLREGGEDDAGIMQRWVHSLRERLRCGFTPTQFVDLWTKLGKELGVRYTDRDGRWVVTLRRKE